MDIHKVDNEFVLVESLPFKKYNINEIKDIADEVVLQWGYDYDVKVEFGKSDFLRVSYVPGNESPGTADSTQIDRLVAADCADRRL